MNIKAGKTVSIVAAVLGLFMAPCWLVVFFGVGPKSPQSDILAMEIVYILWHVLLIGGLAAFISLVVIDKVRRR